MWGPSWRPPGLSPLTCSEDPGSVTTPRRLPRRSWRLSADDKARPEQNGAATRFLAPGTGLPGLRTRTLTGDGFVRRSTDEELSRREDHRRRDPDAGRTVGPRDQPE